MNSSSDRKLLVFAIIGLLAALGNILLGTSAKADAVDDATRLLQVTDTEGKFESVSQRQTRAIIRTYSSIVSTSTEVNLPQRLQQNIADCYARVYAWENFEPGIAQILADNLSQKEMRLLIDFYRNLGLPPMEIQAFKNTIDKADQIRQISTEYIYNNSSGCVEQDVELILDYLASVSSPSNQRLPIDTRLIIE